MKSKKGMVKPQYKSDQNASIAYNLSIFSFAGAVALPVILILLAIPSLVLPGAVISTFLVFSIASFFTALITISIYSKSQKTSLAKKGLAISLVSAASIIILFALIFQLQLYFIFLA